ncbi:hypothetical protein M9H77_28860 [Catharanthus roseus]|uniref:Uncharacterized protein n=1 Tax=Catharanthus roseus TaxID=4058 RepID=A0ACC0AHZ3_CATRO|nr:hypothetical protein M9H77_28860 [Catharanthus roseus]
MSDNYTNGTSTKEDDHEEESKKKSRSSKYEDLILTLPKVERLLTTDLHLYQYQRVWFPYPFLAGIMSIQEQFKAQSTDIVLCSYPKTGTTWLKALTFAISTRNRYFGHDFSISTANNDHPLLNNMPHSCVPFLEADLVHDKRDPQLPLFATHIPYDSLPKSIIESPGCKIIYICRDPKDTFVSLWHFLINFLSNSSRGMKYDDQDEGFFEKEFGLFCEGKSVYGPFWDHVLGFWKASLENPERALFLKYEDMKKDNNNLFYIKKLAEFMNQPFSEEEEDKGVPQKIMELCSFGNLSGLEVNKRGKHNSEKGLGINNSAYFRKGEIGDWKNYLTSEMAETIDRISEEKFGNYGLGFSRLTMTTPSTGITKDDIHTQEESKKKSIKDILPKEERWTNDFDLYRYQDFWFPNCFLEGVILAQEQFKPQPTEIAICSYPKTGSAWLKALCFAISTRNRFGHDLLTTKSNHPLVTKVPHECIPFLEVDLAYGIYNKDPQLPLFATHIPYDSLPKSIIESGCKVIYICRDPKDTFVSLWHALIKFPSTGERKQQFCFKKEFERFCEGKSIYGPFWNHVLGFWKASLENSERVLFLKYEDMKKDTSFYIKRLAEFMNQPFSKEEEDEGLPEKIMEFCSFGNMSGLEVNKAGKHYSVIDNSIYFRKGEVGDWKSHLTKEMAETMDGIAEEKFGTCGLRFGV